MIVLDASAMVELLLDTDLGRRIDARVMAAASRRGPHLLDAEVAQVLRRFVLAKQLPAERAIEALADLAAFPMRRHAHSELLGRVFELRTTLTAYDAIYVALAEALDAPLITCDAALSRAPGRQGRVELMS